MCSSKREMWFAYWCILCSAMLSIVWCARPRQIYTRSDQLSTISHARVNNSKVALVETRSNGDPPASKWMICPCISGKFNKGFSEYGVEEMVQPFGFFGLVDWQGGQAHYSAKPLWYGNGCRANDKDFGPCTSDSAPEFCFQSWCFVHPKCGCEKMKKTPPTPRKFKIFVDRDLGLTSKEYAAPPKGEIAVANWYSGENCPSEKFEHAASNNAGNDREGSTGVKDGDGARECETYLKCWEDWKSQRAFFSKECEEFDYSDEPVHTESGDDHRHGPTRSSEEGEDSTAGDGATSEHASDNEGPVGVDNGKPKQPVHEPAKKTVKGKHPKQSIVGSAKKQVRTNDKQPKQPIDGAAGTTDNTKLVGTDKGHAPEEDETSKQDKTKPVGSDNGHSSDEDEVETGGREKSKKDPAAEMGKQALQGQDDKTSLVGTSIGEAAEDGSENRKEQSPAGADNGEAAMKEMPEQPKEGGREEGRGNHVGSLLSTQAMPPPKNFKKDRGRNRKGTDDGKAKKKKKGNQPKKVGRTKPKPVESPAFKSLEPPPATDALKCPCVSGKFNKGMSTRGEEVMVQPFGFFGNAHYTAKPLWYGDACRANDKLFGPCALTGDHTGDNQYCVQRWCYVHPKCGCEKLPKPPTPRKFKIFQDKDLGLGGKPQIPMANWYSVENCDEANESYLNHDVSNDGVNDGDGADECKRFLNCWDEWKQGQPFSDEWCKEYDYSDEPGGSQPAGSQPPAFEWKQPQVQVTAVTGGVRVTVGTSVDAKTYEGRAAEENWKKLFGSPAPAPTG